MTLPSCINPFGVKRYRTQSMARYGLISDGSNTYIDTEFTSQLETTGSFVWEIKMRTTGTHYNKGMGSAYVAGIPAIVYIGGVASSFGVSMLSANNQVTLANPGVWSTCKIEYDNGTYTVSRDGVIIETGNRGWSNNGWRNFYLFACPNVYTLRAENHAYASIEYSRFTKNGVLERDFRAVPQGNTDYSTTPAPGNCMWDKVSGRYFENQGSGGFEIELVDAA